MKSSNRDHLLSVDSRGKSPSPKSPPYSRKERLAVWQGINGTIQSICLLTILIVLFIRSQTFDNTLVQGQSIMTGFQNSKVLEALTATSSKVLNDYLREADGIMAVVVQLADTVQTQNTTQLAQDIVRVAKSYISFFNAVLQARTTTE